MVVYIYIYIYTPILCWLSCDCTGIKWYYIYTPILCWLSCDCTGIKWYYIYTPILCWLSCDCTGIKWYYIYIHQYCAGCHVIAQALSGIIYLVYMILIGKGYLTSGGLHVYNLASIVLTRSSVLFLNKVFFSCFKCCCFCMLRFSNRGEVQTTPSLSWLVKGHLDNKTISYLCLLLLTTTHIATHAMFCCYCCCALHT